MLINNQKWFGSIYARKLAELMFMVIKLYNLNSITIDLNSRFFRVSFPKFLSIGSITREDFQESIVVKLEKKRPMAWPLFYYIVNP